MQNANHKQTQQLIQEAMKKSGGDREAINKAQAKYMDQLSHMASAQQASSKDMATLLDFVHTVWMLRTLCFLQYIVYVYDIRYAHMLSEHAPCMRRLEGSIC